MNNGKLVISLDFELRWGAVEKWDVSTTRDKFIKTRCVVKEILDLFSLYEIHATWATVGFLFAKNYSEIIDCIPKTLPHYDNSSLNYYTVLNNGEIGLDEEDDKSHYAASIIDLIKSYPNQEIASHTFSHYYALEKGQSVTNFEDDIQSAIKIAEKRSIQLKSLVFPRNQFNEDYLFVLNKYGIMCVRSNPNNWVWSDGSLGKNVFIKFFYKLFRGLDLILPISNTLFSIDSLHKANNIRSVCIPASRFLRPFNSSEKIINTLKKSRIKNEMTKAALTGMIYHLWWHPHNFSNESNSNLEYLKDILIHFIKLRNDHSFKTVNMKELYDQLVVENDNIGIKDHFPGSAICYPDTTEK